MSLTEPPPTLPPDGAGAPAGAGRRARRRAVRSIRRRRPTSQALLTDRPRRRDLLIEHLHLIQDHYGHISGAHLAALAAEMKLAQTEVYEVATFYAHFDVVKEGETPPPPVTVRVCDSLSCALAGAEHLLAELAEKTRAECARRARALHGRLRPRAGLRRRPRPGDAGRRGESHRGGGKARACRMPIRRRPAFDAYVQRRRLRLAQGLYRRQAHARRTHQDRQRCRTARPRRRRLSDRPQMVAGARRAGAAAVRGQLRRRRAGHVQGPLLSRTRSAPLHRGHADRGLDRRGRRHLSLCPRRISRSDPAARRRDRQSRGSGPFEPHQNSSAPRRRRLHLRRRIGDDRIDRGQARPAAPSPALCGAGRLVRPPDARTKCRDAVLGARHRREGRRRGSPRRAATSARAFAAFRSRAASRIPASSSRPPASPRAN